jgi:putative heme-binding domain-containing protein
MISVLWFALQLGRATAAPIDPEEAAAGRELYNRACTICHGLDGTVGDRAPALAGERRFLRTGPEELYDAIRNGIRGTAMPPASLEEDEIWNVVAYIRSLRATAADTITTGNAERGADLFWSKGDCGRCHMIKGRGGILGPDLSNVGGERRAAVLREAMTRSDRRVPRGYRPATIRMRDGTVLEGLVKNEDTYSLQVLGTKDLQLHLLDRAQTAEVVYGERSLMPSDYARRLSTAEIDDVVAFLAGQNAGRRKP